MMRSHIVLLAPLMVSSLYAQPEPAEVYNLTPDAPVAITGTITCSEKVGGAEGHATASGTLDYTDTSDLGIVALEATATVRCGHGFGQSINYHIDDLFFKLNGLPPGERITKTIPEWELPPDPLAESPRVEVKIQLIQFVDGSTWGDSKMMNAVRVRRKKIELQLGRLAGSLDDHEFDSVLNEMLAKFEDISVYSMAYKISMIRKESADAALAEARERLRIGENREASGKF